MPAGMKRGSTTRSPAKGRAGTAMGTQECPVCFEPMGSNGPHTEVYPFACEGGVVHAVCARCNVEIYRRSDNDRCPCCRAARYEHARPAGVRRSVEGRGEPVDLHQLGPARFSYGGGHSLRLPPPLDASSVLRQQNGARFQSLFFPIDPVADAPLSRRRFVLSPDDHPLAGLQDAPGYPADTVDAEEPLFDDDVGVAGAFPGVSALTFLQNADHGLAEQVRALLNLPDLSIADWHAAAANHRARRAGAVRQGR
jgi:hypothetical protein